MFTTATDYHELNAGVHRTRPKNISAPALAWHFAFWSRPNLAQEYGDPLEISKVRRSIDNLFVELCRSFRRRGRCEDVKIFPAVQAINRLHILLFGSVVDGVTLNALDESVLNPREIDILKSSQRTVSLEFRWQGLRYTIRCEIRDEFVTFTCLAEFGKNVAGPDYSTNKNFNDQFKAASDYLKAKDKRQFDVGSIRNFLFREFWNSFDQFVRDDDRVKDAIAAFSDPIVFADFRGLVLGEGVVQFTDYDSRPTSVLTWGSAAKASLLPILKIEETDGKYECAMNYLLDGRAFYLSPLAPQLPGASAGERIPLEYIVYAPRAINKWQLGRVVNNLHVAGTSRLAALKNVRALHEVSRGLAGMDKILQGAKEQVAGVAPNPHDDTDYVQSAHRQLNDITRNFINEAGVGLPYRIERSRYYVNEFQSTTKRLRIKRLEGDQRYDDFVERRLGAEFDFIDRLGRRYERTIAGLAALDQGYVLAQTKETQERMARIAQNQSNVLDQTEKTQKSIADIQEWGEFALLAALIPYYLTHLLEPVINETVRATFVVAVWAVFLAFAAFRKSQNEEDRPALVTLAFLLVAFVLFCVVMSWMPLNQFRLFPTDPPAAANPSGKPSAALPNKADDGQTPQ